MARRETKVVPARKSPVSGDEDSLLIRSAESLGRVIGSLQRQMKGATKRMSHVAQDAMDAIPEMPQMGKRAGGSRKRSGTGKAAAPPKGEAEKQKRTGAGTARAKKPAAARKTSRRKTAGRSR